MRNIFNIPKDILDELTVRFIFSIPPKEKDDMIRVCFQVEAAHWFYQDFYMTKNKNLKYVNIKDFAAALFAHIKSLQPNVYRVDDIIAEWKRYKFSIPTFGAIILNPSLDKVLLVLGYWAKSGWAFPRGKRDEDESPDECAVREVEEEIGFDITSRLHPEDFIQQEIDGQIVRLYLIYDVEETTVFKTNTRCEVKEIRWFFLDTLPTSLEDHGCMTSWQGISPRKFSLTIPFVQLIKDWIDDNFEPEDEDGLYNLTGSVAESVNASMTESLADNLMNLNLQYIPPKEPELFKQESNHQGKENRGLSSKPVLNGSDAMLSLRPSWSKGKESLVDKDKNKVLEEESRNAENKVLPPKPMLSQSETLFNLRPSWSKGKESSVNKDKNKVLEEESRNEENKGLQEESRNKENPVFSPKPLLSHNETLFNLRPSWSKGKGSLIDKEKNKVLQEESRNTENLVLSPKPHSEALLNLRPSWNKGKELSVDVKSSKKLVKPETINVAEDKKESPSKPLHSDVNTMLNLRPTWSTKKDVMVDNKNKNKVLEEEPRNTENLILPPKPVISHGETLLSLRPSWSNKKELSVDDKSKNKLFKEDSTNQMKDGPVLPPKPMVPPSETMLNLRPSWGSGKDQKNLRK